MAQTNHKCVLQTPEGPREFESYIDENGVECIPVKLEDGQTIVLKISDPKDPFFKELKKGLEDIPPLNIDEAISELRDEEF